MNDDEQRKGVRRVGREDCYFCGDEGPIETHHVIPPRFGGTENAANLVDLCPTCRRRLTDLYDESFFGALALAVEEGFGPDYETEVVDREMSKAQRTEERLKSIIDEVFVESDEAGAPVDEVLDRAEEIGIDRDEAEHRLADLRKVGEVYEPAQDRLRTI